MQGAPTDATHIVAITKATPDVNKLTVFRLKDILNANTAKIPFFIQPTMECHVCGVSVPVPDGNLLNHARRLAQEWESDDLDVTITFDHVWNTPQPPGTAQSLVEKRIAEGRTSKVEQPTTRLSDLNNT
jgi:hypothetical protein